MNLLLLPMIQQLRKAEEVILYQRLLQVEPDDEQATLTFLQEEYALEQLEYPAGAPVFCPDAAIWAARTVYTAAQVYLYREHKESDLPLLFPDFSGNTDAAAMLSADLCLRFLPHILQATANTDPDDPMICILQNLLHTWHYSGINASPQTVAEPDLRAVFSNTCFTQLYINRIITRRRSDLAKIPLLAPYVKSTLGIYENELWPGYETNTTL